MLNPMRSETKSNIQQYEAQQYFETLFPRESDAILQSREFAHQLGRSGISLGPLECQILRFLVSFHKPKKFVEIGTLTGTTALTILEAMDSWAELWSFEKSKEHGDLALKAWESEKNKNGKQFHLVLGDAKDTLQTIEGSGPFDGIFIDGNKAAYGDYLLWAEKNLRSGALVIADNVFLSGALWKGIQETPFNEKQVSVMSEFNKRLTDPRFYKSCLVPTDEGLFVALKK